MAFMNDDDAVFDWMDRHGLTERSGPENPFDPVGEDPDPAAHYASAVLPVALSPLMVVLVDEGNKSVEFGWTQEDPRGTADFSVVIDRPTKKEPGLWFCVRTLS
jgi:hypothetical protein